VNGADLASLVIATFDLSVVRLLRGAIATADLASAAAAGGAGGCAADRRIEDRPVLHPEPRIEARQVIYPDPRIEPRRVFHPVVIEPFPVDPGAVAPESERLDANASPLDPPWKKVPWKDPLPAPPPPKVKRVYRPPDISCRGDLFDFFG
jgi:hypothetical protein